MKKGAGKIGVAILLLLSGVVLLMHLPQKEQAVPPQIFPVPGEHELRIEQSGTYTLWHRVRTSYEGRQFVNETGKLSDDVEIYLKNRKTGTKVKVTHFGESMMTVNGEVKVKLFTFPQLSAGVYVLQVFNLQTEEIFSIEKSAVAGFIAKALQFVLALALANASVVMAIIGSLQYLKNKAPIATPPSLPPL